MEDEKPIPVPPRTNLHPTPNIWQRIHAVMREVRAVAKDRTNTHFNFKYTGHEDVTEALRESFLKHGIVRHVTVASESREGNIFRVRVIVRWVNVDAPLDFVESNIPAESVASAKSGPNDQQCGKAISYAVKIAELKTFCLLGDATPDSENYRREPEIQTERRGTEPEQNHDGGQTYESAAKRYQQLIEGKAAMPELQKIRDSVRGVMGRLSPDERKKLGELDRMAYHNANQNGN